MKPLNTPDDTRMHGNKPPEVGQHMHLRIGEVRITRVRNAGTVDVESLDRSHHWRVSGLGFSNTEGNAQ